MYVVGVDFGTLSARALVVRVSDGAELGTAVHEYAHGVIDSQLAGTRLPPDWALQDPADWTAALGEAVPAALARAGVDPAQVIGIATDFTASTCLPVTVTGTPLCQLPGSDARPHAYPKLWKHHAAQPHADRINALAHDRKEPWISRYGGKISAEWQFAKALQLLEEDPEVYAQADRWIEAADWIVWQLCGTETRNACTAGYKGIYQDGQYPSREFLGELNPEFAGFAESKLAHPVVAPLGARAGGLTAAAAALTGLTEGIAVAIGNVDAHVTVAAAGPIAPGKLVAIMGTSTCHVMNGEGLHEVPGMCGAVDGGIVAGLWGYEAGQSGVGDIFAWFVDSNVPASVQDEAARRGVSVFELLGAEAAAQPPGAHGLIALDWLGGNRSVLVDASLSGVIVGLTLATRPAEIYKALLESTAFGTRMIIDTFTAAGVPVTEFVAAGGLIKDPVVMQIYADVINRPLTVIGSAQAPALGSAIHAAVAAGAYPDVPTAAAAMGRARPAAYLPDPARAAVYDQLYAEYAGLHDYFGRGGNEVMHRLRAIIRTNRVLRDHQRTVRAGLRTACRTRPQPTCHLDQRQRICPGTRAGPDGDQAQRCRLRRPDAVRHGGVRPVRHAGQRGTFAVQRCRLARLHLPEHAIGGWRRAHALHVCHRVGGARRGHPVRHHRDGRRVRRGDPARAVRADRRRRDRPRCGRHAHRAPLPRRADAQPRRIHHRRVGHRRGKGGGDVRRRCPDGTPGPRPRLADAAAAGPGGRAARTVQEPLRPALGAASSRPSGPGWS
jgi:L-ribulokinase